MSRVFSVVLGAALMLTSAPLSAATSGKSPIELLGEIKVRQHVVENGVEREVLAEPKVVVPGDELIFRTSFRNTGPDPVKDFVITSRLPDGVALSRGVPELVSVDGGKSWGRLGTLSVADGAGGKRPALAGDVTHLRWVLPEIKPGASGEVTYLASVQ